MEVALEQFAASWSQKHDHSSSVDDDGKELFSSLLMLAGG
jgi:hypothetical protein